MKVKMLVVVSLSLLLSLVEVYSQQIFPYVSFMGQTLANHSYVDLSLVGDIGNTVQCHTDLNTMCSGQCDTSCCTESEGTHRGDWYFPNGNRLQFSDSSDIYERRNNMRVDLRCTGAAFPSGLYRCDISTNNVHNDTDSSVRDTVYIGLYASGG